MTAAHRVWQRVEYGWILQIQVNPIQKYVLYVKYVLLKSLLLKSLLPNVLLCSDRQAPVEWMGAVVQRTEDPLWRWPEGQVPPGRTERNTGPPDQVVESAGPAHHSVEDGPGHHRLWYRLY